MLVAHGIGCADTLYAGHPPCNRPMGLEPEPLLPLVFHTVHQMKVLRTKFLVARFAVRDTFHETPNVRIRVAADREPVSDRHLRRHVVED